MAGIYGGSSSCYLGCCFNTEDALALSCLTDCLTMNTELICCLLAILLSCQYGRCNSKQEPCKGHATGPGKYNKAAPGFISIPWLLQCVSDCVMTIHYRIDDTVTVLTARSSALEFNYAVMILLLC